MFGLINYYFDTTYWNFTLFSENGVEKDMFFFGGAEVEKHHLEHHQLSY